MNKIPTVYLRDWDGDPKYVTREPNPECAWVFAGEGVATRKYDGTCVMYDGERWWARREIKPDRTPPPNFMEISKDEETGKTVGWEPVEQSGFAKWHAEALRGDGRESHDAWTKGTYELCGPKVNGNPEGLPVHWLARHAAATTFADVPLDYDGLAAWLHAARPVEGIVWHHPDGRMAKLKARDLRMPA